MKITTSNLRCVWEGDGVNAFVNRAGLILEKIAAAKPDVIGFQEGTVPILAFLDRNMPDYVREPIKIDYVYADAKTAVLPHSAERWEECLGGVFLSDHHPVCVTIGL